MVRRFAFTVLLPAIVLLLFGLRALDQDRVAVEHQARDRLANTAALAAHAIDQQLANWQQFRAHGVILTGQPVRTVPADASAYEVQESVNFDEPEPELADAERLELQEDWDKAIALYGKLAMAIPRLRTRALLGLGEAYGKAGKADLAAREFAAVIQRPDEPVGALTTQLVARFQLCMLGKGDRTAVCPLPQSASFRRERQSGALLSPSEYRRRVQG